MRIGILCPSEIAFRRFMPALQKHEYYVYAGVSVANEEEWENQANKSMNIMEKIRVDNEKAQLFRHQYGGDIYSSYKSIIEDKSIDAIYIPLPPALHFKWAKMALENGKHVLVEKPATTRREDTEELIRIAQEKQVALHENYMFVFHSQLYEIQKMIEEKEFGEIRLYRISFGFPRRSKTDFRYVKELGGGALLDCGGYTLKYALKLLGNTARIIYANSNYTEEFNVDLYGSAALINNDGTVAQISFGMDNSYKCTLEIWGSKSSFVTERVLTAPAGYTPSYTIQKEGEIITGNFSEDDTFYKSLDYFKECIQGVGKREEAYQEIYRQADLVEVFKQKAMEVSER